ncbi:MAG: alpha/beta hydrolase [Lachnospiraceae bacterium]|nr:alpha/beta hydrolase [Lachnospiraceae bacterium]
MLVTEFKLYENREDVTLTAYVLAEKGELRGQGLRPAVLICPGGGYFNCSDREAEPVALAFAAMGYHAFVLRYSTYMEGAEGFVDLFSDFEVKEHLTHPAPVREIGMAMLLIREHARDWMVDMDRVAVCGFSAGAHNSAMYGVYWDKPLITDFLGVEKEAIRPAALILGYTLSDYILLRDSEKNELDEAFFRGSVKAFTGEAQPSEEKLIEVSPARLVSEMTPPAFLWATAADGMVPVQHSLRMAHALADHHVPFELHVFEEGDHGMSVATQASSVAKSQMNADAAKWIGLADAWLKKRFALDLPEKTAFEEAMQNGSI